MSVATPPYLPIAEGTLVPFIMAFRVAFPDSFRMKIVVLPSWYPTERIPYAGSFLRSIARALADAGHDVTVLFPELESLLTWRPGIGSGELVERQDGPIREFRWRGYRWWPRERHGTIAFTSAARRLFVEYLQRFNLPDVIHAHISLPAGAAAAKLSSVWEVPFVLSEQAGPFSMMAATTWQRWGVHRATSRATIVTAVSAAERNAMQAEGVTRPIEVVPNALDPEFLQPPEAPPPAADGAIRFLTVAGLREGKGLEDLIRAFEQVSEALPSARLTIAGDGELRSYLELLADELDLSKRVEFAGMLRSPVAVRRCMLEHDVFVLPSHGETFGMVLAEALACGRPVVATRCGGPESIVTSADGTLVAVGDVAGLASAMLDVATRRGDFPRERLHAEAVSRFGPQIIGRQFADVLERAVAEYRRAANEA